MRDGTVVNVTRSSRTWLEEILKTAASTTWKMQKGRRAMNGVGIGILCDNSFKIN